MKWNLVSSTAEILQDSFLGGHSCFTVCEANHGEACCKLKICPQHETMVFQRKSVGDWLFSKAGKKLLTNCHSSVAQCQIKSNINSACANDEQRGIAWNNTPFKFSTIIYLLLAKVSYEPPSTIVKILAPLPPSRIKGIIICLNSHWPHNIP